MPDVWQNSTAIPRAHQITSEAQAVCALPIGCRVSLSERYQWTVDHKLLLLTHSSSWHRMQCATAAHNAGTTETLMHVEKWKTMFARWIHDFCKTTPNVQRPQIKKKIQVKYRINARSWKILLATACRFRWVEIQLYLNPSVWNWRIRMSENQQMLKVILLLKG